MKLTKTQLKQLIKETLEEVAFGLGQPPAEEGQPVKNKEVEAIMQQAADLYSQGGPEVKKELTEKFAQAVEDWKREQASQGGPTL